MRRSNLFAFATSELSQDAFLCWLASLSNSDDLELASAGRGFLGWLWRSSGHDEVSVDRIQLIHEPERQLERIDVVLRAEIDGERVAFLIEDKTETTHHSNQLVRYRDEFRREGLSCVVPIYFKTGYHFDEDRAAREVGYSVIGLEAWVAFLESLRVRNDILEDYREFMSSMLRERLDSLEGLWKAADCDRLGSDYVQFEFMSQLQNACSNAVGDGGSLLYRGRNVGGSPWTQIRFWSAAEALPDGIEERLFLRVDKRMHGNAPEYYLSTRQYAVVKGNQVAKTQKLARLRIYRDLFDAAVRASGSSLVFERPASDYQGANESEIGVLFFDDSRNSPDSVLEGFPAVHAAFVRAVHAALGRSAHG